MNARHLSKTANWGSTEDQLGLGRRLMGGRIDLDVASSAFWNTNTVHARRFYTKRDNALTKVWRARRVWLNPPGDPSGILVKAFWLKLVEHWLDGDIREACYVGFSLDQFVSLQGIYDSERTPSTLPSPLDFPTLIPMRRTAFLMQRGKRVVESEAPSHGNFFTWLPPKSLPVSLLRSHFWRNANALGACHFPLPGAEAERLRIAA